MAIAQADLTALNSAIDTVKAALAAVLAGMAAGEELIWTPDTDIEPQAGPFGRRILLETETGDARAAGNNAQMVANMNGLLNHGAFTSSDAV